MKKVNARKYVNNSVKPYIPPPVTPTQPRFFFAAFFIFLEFIQIMNIFILLNYFSIIMSILSVISAVVVTLIVINIDEITEFKLPWLILFIVLPIIGAFIYILFNGTENVKKLKDAFNKTNEMLAPYSVQDIDVLDAMKEQDIDAFLQANYIHHACFMPCNNRTKVTYYPVGEDFHAALLIELEKAERFIFMEYFIIEKGKMWDSILEILLRKVKSGVKVHLIYDDVGNMKTLHQHYYKELKKQGIECITFNRFRPIMSQIHNNRDHRKITVIDGIVGFTGGVNIADEYINAKTKFGHWKDNAIKMEGEGVKNLTMIFLSSWNTQTKAALDCESFLKIDYPNFKSNGTVIAYGDGPAALYKDAIGRDVYLNMINAAKEYIYITTPYLICDAAFLKAIGTAAKKGVDVRIIMPGVPDKKLVFLLSRSNYEPLIRDGVKIYEYTPGFLHAKTFVCDDKYAVCGTINLDYRSLIHHYECAAWLYNMDAVHDMKKDLIETMDKSELISAEKANLTWFQRLIRNIMKIFFPLL
jgi:cardiolipin synthase